ncbi:hypothetical protein HMPREF9601_02501 [Cutibacterium acnes HL030PA1]|nr:hypothetical protein HMPREF9601_02501 [Cutibacterium acnes HL030PA1]
MRACPPRSNRCDHVLMHKVVAQQANPLAMPTHIHEIGHYV